MLRSYQWLEVVGIILVFLTTATQIFYLEPVKREIEWRLAAFSQQQNGQILAKAIFDNRIAVLGAMNASGDQLEKATADRDKLLQRYKDADANVANMVIDKQDVEGYLQIVVAALFGLGIFFTVVGRIVEMRSLNAE